MMGFQCPNCGEVGLRDKARFCDNCGRELSQMSRGDAATSEPQRSTLIEDEASASDTSEADASEADGATIAMPQAGTTAVGGATIDLSQAEGSEDEASEADVSEDDGATIAMPQAGTTAVGKATTDLSEAEGPEADGATRAMPETGTTAVGGATIDLSGVGDAKDEAPEVDGATIAMSEVDASYSDVSEDDVSETDGATKAMPETKKSEVRPEMSTIIMAGLEVGQVLQKRYRLDNVLGRGGFGAVYLAQDVKLKRICVVKQMLIRPGASAKDIEIYRSNFEREADLLVQLNHPGHPNIPEIYDYFTDASGNYLVMKYIEGQSLKDILDKGEGKISWREAVRYAIDVCNALNYMHSLGGEPVMHRDIKPANILLGDDGRVWLVDFGLAKANPVEGADDLGVTQAAGSVGYTPFEQWLGEATPFSDVYALGVTLHHLVTGLNPIVAFEGNVNIQKLQELHGQFTSLRKVDRGLPKELDGIVAQATAAEPGHRPTALQLKQQLEAMISSTQDIGLFTFKSGETAKTSNDLVDLCEKYRQEAQEYLYQGDFERWFVIINRNDLAEAAVQAVKRGKNQKDGLEKFLKLIVPNLFLRRLGKASWQLTRVAIQATLIFVIVLLFVVIGGSYIARWFIQQSISGYDWNYGSLDLAEENYYTAQFLTEKFRAATQSYLNDIQVVVRSPNRLEVEASWAGIPLDLPVALRLEDEKPHFYFSEVNDIPLFLVADNISQGINRGVDSAFQRGPVDVSNLEVQDDLVIFTVKPSGRAPFPSPTPARISEPTLTPTPINRTLLAIFNDVGHDIILEIEGETWEIAAYDTKVIEKKPGTYSYTVRYSETGQLASQGTRTWALKVYRWHIDLAEE